MKRLTPRETMLAALVGGAAFLVVNLALFSTLKKKSAQAAADLASRRQEVAALREIAQTAPLWQERDAWLSAHQPKLENPSQAGVQLLETLRQAAKANDVLLESPELGSAGIGSAYRPVAVQVQTKSAWGSLIAFLNTLQQPENFVVFESAELQIDPSDATKMRGRLRVAKWYAP